MSSEISAMREQLCKPGSGLSFLVGRIDKSVGLIQEPIDRHGGEQVIGNVAGKPVVVPVKITAAIVLTIAVEGHEPQVWNVPIGPSKTRVSRGVPTTLDSSASAGVVVTTNA